jgi:hypothetical protein
MGKVTWVTEQQSNRVGAKSVDVWNVVESQMSQNYA